MPNLVARFITPLVLRRGLAVGLLTVLVLPWLNRGADSVARLWRDHQFGNRFPEFVTYYSLAKKRVSEGDYAGALQVLDRALGMAPVEAPNTGDYIAATYAMKAESHWQLAQYLDAETALEHAIRRADDDFKQRLRSRLSGVQTAIAWRETKRLTRDTYVAAPGIGPAGRLRGKVAVVYVFVDDGRVSKWTHRTRQAVLHSLSGVEEWYRLHAEGYGVDDVNFVHRIFVYDRDPFLRNLFDEFINRDIKTGYNVAARVAKLQGASSVNAFLDHVMHEEDAEQAILLLHANKTTRSYAIRCSYRCWSEAEYAVLFRRAERNDLLAIPYVQAHEGLHLFGAADIYKLPGAHRYAPRDIMNHRARKLSTVAVDSITAYAIGWIARQPASPFPIENAGRPHPGETR